MEKVIDKVVEIDRIVHVPVVEYVEKIVEVEAPRADYMKPDYSFTSQQFEDYYMNTVIPNYDQAYPGAKIYLADGFLGEYKGSLSMIWIFESIAVRNAYFGSNAKELSQEIQDKLKSVDDGLALLGSWTSKFTDWSIR